MACLAVLEALPNDWVKGMTLVDPGIQAVAPPSEHYRTEAGGSSGQTPEQRGFVAIAGQVEDERFHGVSLEG